MDLLSELERRVLICDGAMGTQLIERGCPPGSCFEQWGAEHAEALAGVHRDYLAAGCDLITTNTFGGNRAALERHGLAAQVKALCTSATAAAKRAAAARAGAMVLGDVGPLGVFLEPLGDLPADQAAAIFAEQAGALREGGADGVIVETMTDPEELSVAVKAANSVADWPVIATFAFDRGAEEGCFATMMGTGVEEAVKRAIDAGADVVGANCGTKLTFEDYVRLAEQIVRAAQGRSTIVQPNAGVPEVVGGKTVYAATPADAAAAARRMRDAGVRVIGGCCGTTPGHLRAIADAIRE